jgi:dTDP-4-amino-4,6-dideoxygalactose transaminase
MNIPGISIPSEEDLNYNSCHLYILRILKNRFPISRDQLFQELLSAGVRTTVHYKPLNKFSIFRKLGKIGDKLKNSNELYDEILSLPLYPDIKKEEQKIVIKAITSIQKK